MIGFMKNLEITWAYSKRRGKCLDFFVSGKSLLKEIERRGRDLVPRLGTSLLPIESSLRDMLLLHSTADSPSGRVVLYVCSECGDFGCGVVSVKVNREGSDFVWSSFVYENDGENKAIELEKIGPFRFSADNYLSALSVTMV